MLKNHLESIMMMEKLEQSALKGKPLAVIVDGTPYRGEALATVVRAVDVRKSSVNVLTTLIDLYFAKSNVNSVQLKGVLHRAFNKTGLRHSETAAFLSDAISVNTSAFQNQKSI